MMDLDLWITTSELRASISDVMNRAEYGGERVGVSRRDQLVAVVIGVNDYRRLLRLEAEHGQQDAEQEAELARFRLYDSLLE